MTLSVVVAVRNEERNISRLVHNVRACAPTAELIIVDNDSEDRTFSLAKDLADQVLSCPGTVSEARLLGARTSESDFVLFMDADQALRESTISDALRLAHEKNAPAVVIPERPMDPESHMGRGFALEREVAEAGGAGIPRLFLREAYLRSGGHPSGVAFGEDWALLVNFASPPRSATEILHSEPRTLREIASKYYRYGLVESGGHTGATARLRALSGLPRVAAANDYGLRAVLQLLLIKTVKGLGFGAGSLVKAFRADKHRPSS